MLIVSKSYRSSADLHNKVDILLVVAGKKRVADTPSVLVTGYTAQRIFLTVKNKAVVGINSEGAHTEATTYVIKHLITLNYLCLTAVKVGIASAVPEVNALKVKYYLGIPCEDLSYLVFFLIVNRVANALCLGYVLYENLNLNLGVLADYLGGNLKSATAEVIKVKVAL